MASLTLKPGKNTVSYMCMGDRIAANLFLPDNYVAGEKRPAIIINPPASGVKEQTNGVYAEALSKRGFVTLALDPRGFGESEGIRQLQNGYRVAEDIQAGVGFLCTLEQVDKGNVFAQGICAGSGYATYATAFDTRINAVAIVSPYLTSQEEFLAQVGGSANLRKMILPAAAVAEQAFYETGQNMMTHVVPVTDEQIAAGRGITLGMRDYYLPGMPGEAPNWKNELSLLSSKAVLSFSIYDYTHMFDAVPVFMAYGDKAVSVKGAVRFYEALNGPKEMIKREGAGHFDLYWRPEHVEPIADGIATFFNNLM